ncbi:MAG: RNA 2',3'-cyclic phosphodiesterase [Clostridia bacterium]
MRLFIAIELSKNMKSEIELARASLIKSSAGGRFVSIENMHLTLRFLGESNNSFGAVNAISESARGIRPFPIHLGGYGFFGGGPFTSYLNVLGDLSELNAIYDSLQSALFDEGFSREYKRFSPHITLGRNVIHDDKTVETMNALRLQASMQVQSITLFESTRGKNGMIYTAMHRERFK